MFEYLYLLNQTSASFSISWNFCQNHQTSVSLPRSYRIKLLCLFHLVQILPDPWSYLQNQTSMSFPLSWNFAWTAVLLQNQTSMSFPLSRNLPELWSYYRIKLLCLFHLVGFVWTAALLQNQISVSFPLSWNFAGTVVLLQNQISASFPLS